MKKQLIIMVIVNVVMGILAVFPMVIGVISARGGMGFFTQPVNSDIFVGLLIIIGILLIAFIVNKWFYKRLQNIDKKYILMGPAAFFIALVLGYFVMM